MRPAKITEHKLYDRISGVFRKKGYDGATYAELMRATGLVKASLYHRFPGGKEDMVEAVLSAADKRFSEYVLAPAFTPGPVLERTRQVARNLGKFYSSGESWCLLDTLTLTDNPAVLRHARRSMEMWIDTFARLSIEAGTAPESARRRARAAVAAIQGALVVSRVTGDRHTFLRTLGRLPRLLGVAIAARERA